FRGFDEILSRRQNNWGEAAADKAPGLAHLPFPETHTTAGSGYFEPSGFGFAGYSFEQTLWPRATAASSLVSPARRRSACFHVPSFFPFASQLGERSNSHLPPRC